MNPAASRVRHPHKSTQPGDHQLADRLRVGLAAGRLHDRADQRAGGGDLAAAHLLGDVGVGRDRLVDGGGQLVGLARRRRGRGRRPPAAGSPSPASTPSSTCRASLSLSVPSSTSRCSSATCAGVTPARPGRLPASLARRASSPSHHLRASAGVAPAATVAATSSSAPALSDRLISVVRHAPLLRQPGRRARGSSGRAGRELLDPRRVRARSAPGRARGSTGSRSPPPCCRPGGCSPVSSWKCRVSWMIRPPASSTAACRRISERTARSTERSELTFFVSVRVPHSAARAGSARCSRRSAASPAPSGRRRRPAEQRCRAAR